MKTLLFSLLLFVSAAALAQVVPADAKVIPNSDTFISTDSISAIIEPLVRKKAKIMLDGKEITIEQFKKLYPQGYKSPVILTPEEASQKYGKKCNIRVIVLTSKSEIESDKTIYTKVKRMPEFPGGEAAIYAFIQNNLRYPQEALNLRMQGNVIVSFTVRYDGRLTDIKIIRGIAPSLDNEAIRVISKMPDWIPGFQDGKTVSVRFVMPLRFILQ